MGPIVEITVKGDHGSGKTTFCDIIVKALKKEGLTNWTVGGQEGENAPNHMSSFDKRVKSLKEGNVEVRVVTVQAKRGELLQTEKPENERR